mmetsp:Transcript_18844/g.46224  ORF Transcript_18844/g.46224 Transcript_18844/m.46224 type:complete len:203 (-) Transcript_18844:441-1049(-)
MRAFESLPSPEMAVLIPSIELVAFDVNSKVVKSTPAAGDLKRVLRRRRRCQRLSPARGVFGARSSGSMAASTMRSTIPRTRFLTPSFSSPIGILMGEFPGLRRAPTPSNRFPRKEEVVPEEPEKEVLGSWPAPKEEFFPLRMDSMLRFPAGPARAAAGMFTFSPGVSLPLPLAAPPYPSDSSATLTSTLTSTRRLSTTRGSQ